MHPEIETEQAYIDKAYACLESARLRALDLALSEKQYGTQ